MQVTLVQTAQNLIKLEFRQQRVNMLVSTSLISSATELFVVFVLTLIFVFYIYYRHCYTYWKKKGVPQLSPTFPTGNLSSVVLGKESLFVRLQSQYHEFKNAGHNFGGLYFFNGPVFMAVDPELVKKILVTNFDHFVDRGMYINEKKIPITAHMFSMKGEQWKNVRAKFTPTFTSGKMKSMYNILVQNCENLVKTLEPMAEQELVIDIKELLMRFTTDIIGSTAFGVDCNTLKYPETEFAQMVAMIFNSPKWKLYKLALEEGFQNPGNVIKIAHDNKTVQRYFTDLVRNTIDYRDKNNVVRDDFLNILMQMRSSGMTFQEIVAQSFLFFTAGFETSSSTMSNCIHELAYNQDIQDKLREEIQETLGTDSSKYTYEDVLGLPYLDKVIKETLRKYPPVAMLNRICVKPYKVPDTDVVIEVDTPIIISVLGLHRDPDYFTDPLEFDPERFNGENKIVPFTYLPFGDGPRNCIGLRFGLMQTKLGLATLLNHFKFYSSPKSPRHLEIDPSTTTLVLTVLNGVHTKIVKV